MSVKDFKEKGFEYERQLAGKIGVWWCEDKKALWRNTTSGARATVMGGVFGGDIIPANGSSVTWPLCIEVKKAEGWKVEAFLQQNPANLLLTHMLQCLHASQLGCNKIPLLICKKNYQKALCFVYPHALKKFKPSTKPFLARLKWITPVPEKLQAQYPFEGPIDFFCLHLDTFFQTFSKADFV